MSLTLDPILHSAGIDPVDAHVIRHAYVREHEDSGLPGIHADSTDKEILRYTGQQSAKPRVFPVAPPPLWLIFIKEGGDRARLWSVLENHGETSNDGTLRTFDLGHSEHLADLRNRLVIGWRSPRAWRINATTALATQSSRSPDSEPIPFPGFDKLVLDYAQLQAVMREHRYASWRTALASAVGIYLITDTSDGRHYVGKADGAESIRQRWNVYATNGHGGQRRAPQRQPDDLPLLAAACVRPRYSTTGDRCGGEPLQARTRLAQARPETELSRRSAA